MDIFTRSGFKTGQKAQDSLVAKSYKHQGALPRPPLLRRALPSREPCPAGSLALRQKPSRGENRPKKNLLVTQKRLQILKEERIPSSDLVLLFPNCEF